MRRPGARALLAAGGALLLVSIGCRAPGPGGQRGRRVVVVSAPGLSWELLSPMLASGRLPVLAGLYRSGSAGILVSDDGLAPEAIAATLASGAPAARHGMGRSVERTPGTWSLRPVGADRRRAPSIWSRSTPAGPVAGVAGWAGSFPAEAIDGYLVAGGAEPGERGWIFPVGALGAEPAGEESLDRPEPATRLGALDPVLRGIVDDDLANVARTLTLSRVYQPGLIMLELDAVDRVSHRFWRFHEPRFEALAVSRGEEPAPAERAAALAGAVAGSVEFIDACLGILMERLPEGTTLLVVSGWGMRGVAPADYLDIDLHRLLVLLGWATADEAGRLDPAGSRAIALHDEGQRPRALYLNVESREAGGLLPAAEAARAREELARSLASLETLQGERLFSSVVPIAAPDAGGPDIELIPNAAISPGGLVRIGDQEMPVVSLWLRWHDTLAAHQGSGVLVAAGEPILKGITGFSARATQLAPTLRAILGLPCCSEGEDPPVAEILRAESLEGRPGGAGGGLADPPEFAPVSPVRRDPVHVKRALERMAADGHLSRVQ